MAKSNNQKAKILYLERMLGKTGENCAVSMQEILSRLGEEGISAERKSIYDDLDVLRSFGMDIRYRREKPGGYYLAGAAVETREEAKGVLEGSVDTAGTNAPGTENAPGAEDTVRKPEVQPDHEGWMSGENGEKDRKKQMKLLCGNGVRKSVKSYFGSEGEYKEKGRGAFTVTAKLMEGPKFFGWLASMDKSIHILKPKKMAEAYRDYLKSLAKEYRDI